MREIMVIDGSHGEGGGQILRTSLALSIITGTPIRLERIRAGRQKPGLMRQHLTAVLAAAEISGAQVEGAVIGSQELVFRPGPAVAGEYRFAVGTAGSAGLVMQTVLPPLLCASAASRVVFEGGTHNSMSPPFEFLRECFVPLLGRMGASVELELVQHGFYPAGGGRFIATVAPWTERRPLELMDGGAVTARKARALVSQLPPSIGNRELMVIHKQLGWDWRDCRVETVDAPGPGNVLLCHIEREHVTEIVAAFGERGVKAERVAERAVAEVQAYLDANVPVGEHLADQLMIPMALAGSGCYRTLPLSLHSQTNREVICRFLDVAIEAAPAPGGAIVSVSRR